MSKLIVEMEMPKRCINCGVRLKCKRYVCGLQQDIAEDLNPLMGDKDCLIKGVLPEEHGDLIDRDRLNYRVMAETNPYGKPTIEYESGKKVMQMIENAFTVIPAERKEDSMPSQGRSLPCWTDGPDGCEELTYHGMAECLRHCANGNDADCRYDCQYVERDTGACLHEYLMSDAADYLDKAAAIIEKMKKSNIAIAAERKDDEQIH